ncbi:AAC(3) family N-acetyltransferase [Cyclobacterium sp. SYSU L10401]|uniref:AAC(3) family N-acetyltransferase n=1 Tax=Cyclobacterium sp. SYSU L10401 TaxID=2678657 RepID=UPI0013D44286|nr:AAC(3) family N-acetyltransferase [Cyclobacterium sp. SYSU L10401]
MNWKQRIQKDLSQLRLGEGDHVLVHASLNSLGRFPDRAKIVVSALLDLLGPGGTLLMPALSYQTVTPENPIFDLSKTPACVGALPEFFRTFPGAQRSMHPTHSVCAIGELSDYFLSDHLLDDTPCGPHSPFAKLPEVHGKILFLGCGTRPNTSMHAVEERIKPPYLLGARVNYTLKDQTGRKMSKSYFRHDFAGFEQRYERVEGLLGSDSCQKGKVLQAASVLMDARSLWEKGTLQLKKDPYFFVDRKGS